MSDWDKCNMETAAWSPDQIFCDELQDRNLAKRLKWDCTENSPAKEQCNWQGLGASEVKPKTRFYMEDESSFLEDDAPTSVVSSSCHFSLSDVFDQACLNNETWDMEDIFGQSCPDLTAKDGDNVSSVSGLTSESSLDKPRQDEPVKSGNATSVKPQLEVQIPPVVLDGYVQACPESVSSSEENPFEATVLYQLGSIMSKLKLDTRLSIRNALYRLAKSASYRNGDENSDISSTKSSGLCLETCTNPIDRQVASLLFYKPEYSSQEALYNSGMPLTSTPIMGTNPAHLPVMRTNAVVNKLPLPPVSHYSQSVRRKRHNNGSKSLKR